MNENKPTELVALSEANFAESLSELFGSFRENFSVYMDETIHSDPNNPISPKHAGRDDAMLTPPRPFTDETEPADDNYVSQLYAAARVFFRQYTERCRSRFGVLKARLDVLISNEPWSRENWKNAQDSLAHSIRESEVAKMDMSDYQARNKEKVGNAMLEPPRPSALIFVSWVFFIAVFECVWVWYFLSEQLGASAIYISMVASTLVVLIAALCAFAQANRAVDLSKTWKTVGTLGVAFCILLFIFGVGLLSGWRADSTNEGLEVVIGGYRSLTKMDVFVTAVINLAGFIFLTREFKRYFWPYPLYYYAQHKTKSEASVAKIAIRRDGLRAVLSTAREEVERRMQEIKDELRKMEGFQRDVARNILSASRSLEEIVAGYQGVYAGQNLIYRTTRAYASPRWLENCEFKVFDEETRSDLEVMQAEFKDDYEDYQARCKEYLKKLDAAIEEIETIANANREIVSE